MNIYLLNDVLLFFSQGQDMTHNKTLEYIRRLLGGTTGDGAVQETNAANALKWLKTPGTTDQER